MRVLDLAFCNAAALNRRYWAPKGSHTSNRLFFEAAIVQLLSQHGNLPIAIPSAKRSRLAALKGSNALQHLFTPNVGQGRCKWCLTTTKGKCLDCPDKPAVCAACVYWLHEKRQQELFDKGEGDKPPKVRLEPSFGFDGSTDKQLCR